MASAEFCAAPTGLGFLWGRLPRAYALGYLCFALRAPIPVQRRRSELHADACPSLSPAFGEGWQEYSVLSRRSNKRTAYSSFSGSSAMLFSPAAFFSQYLRTQASQLLPAAVSRPVKARAAMSE